MLSGGGAHLSGEKETMKGGGHFPPAIAFIGRGQRGGLGGPLGSATDVGVEPDRRTGGAHWVPLLWVVDVWVQGRYLNVVRAGLALRAHCSDPNRVTIYFKTFQIEPNFKFEKPPLYCSKNSQILHAAILEGREQLSFWNQVQIRIRIEIKNSGSRTISEHELNLFEVQLVCKNIINSPKFIFAFFSQNMNLD
jgi:hypothetical protein